jgi:DNA-binding protein YbaB
VQPNLSPGEDFQYLLDKQIREMQGKAAALTEAFAESSATVSSRDGAVKVTVAANGSLSNLELGNRACEMGPARLTAAIMETVRAAQRKTANTVADSFIAINGDGETADLIRSFLPVEEEEPVPAANDQFAGTPEPEPEATPPSRPVPPVPPVRPAPPTAAPAPPPPPRRSRPAGNGDDDEMSPW